MYREGQLLPISKFPLFCFATSGSFCPLHVFWRRIISTSKDLMKIKLFCIENHISLHKIQLHLSILYFLLRRVTIKSCQNGILSGILFQKSILSPERMTFICNCYIIQITPCSIIHSLLYFIYGKKKSISTLSLLTYSLLCPSSRYNYNSSPWR